MLNSTDICQFLLGTYMNCLVLKFFKNLVLNPHSLGLSFSDTLLLHKLLGYFLQTRKRLFESLCYVDLEIATKSYHILAILNLAV